MKRLSLSALALLLVMTAAAQNSAAAGQGDAQVRQLQGQVVNEQEAPLASAVVYLKNTKTLAVKSYITQKDGMYRFSALSPNIDYEVYAEHNGRKSATKTLSSFDSRKTATINLKIR